MSESGQDSAKRSGCFILFLAILSLYQIFFAFRVFNDNGLYGNSLSLPPIVQAGLAVLWAILFLVALLGLVRGQSYAVGYSAWLMISFIVYSLLRIVFFAQADYDRQRIPFLVVGTILILIIPAWLLLRGKAQGMTQ